MVASAVLGYPRIGPKREIKKAVEAYWADKIDAAELERVGAEIRLANWKKISSSGVSIVPSADFTFYDHVLDTSILVGNVPEKHAAAAKNNGLSELDLMFAMGRGRQRDGVDVEANEMKKWFDSNYHFIVPEVNSNTTFNLSANPKPVAHYAEAKKAGIDTRPVLLGPVSYLVLSKLSRSESNESFKPISLLEKLLPVYAQVLSSLEKEGAKSVQIDEPVLVLDQEESLASAFKTAYEALSKAAPSLAITIATYFGRLDSNVSFVKDLPIAALHIDLDRAPKQLDSVVAAIKDTKLVLSLGLVSGRNIWKNDLAASISTAQKAISALGEDRVVVATSSSLLHCPISLANESRLTDEQRSWFSFAEEKCNEVALIAGAVSGKADDKALEENKAAIAARREFEAKSDSAVRDRLAAVKEEMYHRKSNFDVRSKAQADRVKLPKFPTTTIGSFPQTSEIRQARAKFTKKEINQQEYEAFLEKEIQHVIKFQQDVGLDVLVHGEPERNDMVQYFGEQLTGFVFTQNAWVQSYGSRYVRPPIIVSDVSRPHAMTVRWTSYAQSLTSSPVKGMLTGPVTILNWSFPRVDVSKEIQSRQLALALRDEVLDLEKAGIFAIQVDEPAIREGLPLRRVDWDEYLKWAVDSFKLSTAGVADSTQCHSHFCYSDFNDIFPHIARLDADVISIEASKSSLKLLDVFTSFDYSNDIGPGLYDIHSPRVPSLEEIKKRISEMVDAGVKKERLVINPDCGLKTRGWKETEASLKNLVDAAKWARQTYA